MSATLLCAAEQVLRAGMPSEADYVLARLAITGEGCWAWTAGCDPKGYGKVKRGDRTIGVHRWVWCSMYGSLGDGIELDHLCRNPACFNPEHLEPVTASENVRRGHAARGVYDDCRRGHGMKTVDSKGKSTCPRCTRELAAERRARYRLSPPPRHGLPSSYTSRGCRCDECTGVMREYRRRKSASAS